MTSRNEAAERLQSHIRAGDNLSETVEYHADLLMQSLAAERRATVERIRRNLLLSEGAPIPEEYAIRILDEEAARG